MVVVLTYLLEQFCARNPVVRGAFFFTTVVLFIEGPEMTAPELISSSILGSRSDKLLRCV